MTNTETQGRIYDDHIIPKNRINYICNLSNICCINSSLLWIFLRYNVIPPLLFQFCSSFFCQAGPHEHFYTTVCRDSSTDEASTKTGTDELPAGDEVMRKHRKRVYGFTLWVTRKPRRKEYYVLKADKEVSTGSPLQWG